MLISESILPKAISNPSRLLEFVDLYAGLRSTDVKQRIIFTPYLSRDRHLYRSASRDQESRIGDSAEIVVISQGPDPGEDLANANSR